MYNCNIWLPLSCSAEGGYAPAPAGPAMHGSTSPVSPAGAALGELEPQPHNRGSTNTYSSSVNTTTATSSSSSSAGGAVKNRGSDVSGSNLASASTAQGPLVITSVEEGAQTQQVLQLMDNYDFRCGCTAGPALLLCCGDAAVRCWVIIWILAHCGRLPARQPDVVVMCLSRHNIDDRGKLFRKDEVTIMLSTQCLWVIEEVCICTYVHAYACTTPANWPPCAPCPPPSVVTGSMARV
jgi:hypothetical protein